MLLANEINQIRFIVLVTMHQLSQYLRSVTALGWGGLVNDFHFNS